MREALTKEALQSFPSQLTIGVATLVEHRLQTAIMAGVLEPEIKEKVSLDIKIKRKKR